MKGVTLLELLIVTVILAIMASVAFPLYLRVISRSKESEGWVFLTAIRSAELRYYDEHEEIFTTTSSQLDLDVTATPFFSYCIRQSAAQNFTAFATPQAACGGCRRFCLDNAGTRGEGGACPSCP